MTCRLRVLVIALLAIGTVSSGYAQGSPPSESAPEIVEPKSAAADEAEARAAAEAAAAAADRTELNLLGEVDAKSGEGRRNENVRISLIDNNVLIELNRRLGTSTTLIRDAKIDQTYWGSELGGPPRRAVHLRSSAASAVHGNVFWAHTNSAFSSRSFFQVGKVQPARSNDYGFTVSTPLWKGAAFTVDGSQGRNRGQVNGNVLVPSLDERTPLTNDPELMPIVSRILQSFPAVAPNRTDISPRALNTNAPQSINNDRIRGTFEQQFGDNRVTARYGLVRQKVDAFQLVAGQSPNTVTRNHQFRLTWSCGFRRRRRPILRSVSIVPAHC